VVGLLSLPLSPPLAPSRPLSPRFCLFCSLLDARTALDTRTRLAFWAYGVCFGFGLHHRNDGAKLSDVWDLALSFSFLENGTTF
jgi:hypothetical protein